GCGGGGGGGSDKNGGTTGNPDIKPIKIEKAVASATEQSWDASRAIDGDYNTSWVCGRKETAADNNQYIYLDFGSAQTIAQVAIYWGDMGYAEKYTLQVSDDAATWTDVYTENAGDGHIDSDALSTPASGRYLRLNMSQCSVTCDPYLINEIKVYSESGAEVPTAPTENMLWNGDFKYGVWQWGAYGNPDVGGAASGTVTNGVLDLAITNGGTEVYAVQVRQGSLKLKKNHKYALTFDAWADADDRPAQVFLQEEGRDNNGDGSIWSEYDTSKNLTFSTTRKTYRFVFFMMSPDDTKGALVFSLGKSAVGVHLANLLLTDSEIGESIDTGFAQGTWGDSVYQNPSVDSMLIQDDGKIIVAGRFDSYNGINAHGLIRLNADGSRDTSFDIGVGPQSVSSGKTYVSYVSKVVKAKNGKIFACGGFTTFNGSPSQGVVLLNSDGTVDTSFVSGITGASVYIEDMEMAPGGQIILVKGDSPFIIRLNADGSVDSGYNPSAKGYGHNIAVQSDGKVIDSWWDGTSASGLRRYNVDGTDDSTFNPAVGSGYQEPVALPVKI
ncbi:MAG TPA: discoidin domain-containing protein, partial [Spirochaetota bacterium]|nr:discoidin domain-containing protein [Spirochaetota bacterium]